MNTRYRKYPWRRRLKRRWPQRLLLLALAGWLGGLVQARCGAVQAVPACDAGAGILASGESGYARPGRVVETAPPMPAKPAAMIDAVYRVDPGLTACRTQRLDGAAAWMY